VKAPPTARVAAVTPAIRSARTTTAAIAKRRIRKPMVPAVAGSTRRKRRGEIQRTSQWLPAEPTVIRITTVAARTQEPYPGSNSWRR
jgi:hypothetical protein